MGYMFANCPALTSLDLSFFDTTDVKSFERMFYNCTGLRELNISSFSSKHKNYWYAMLYNCSSMENLNLGKDFGADPDYYWAYGLGADAAACTVTCSPEDIAVFLQGYPGGYTSKFTFINASTGETMLLP